MQKAYFRTVLVELNTCYRISMRFVYPLFLILVKTRY